MFGRFLSRFEFNRLAAASSKPLIQPSMIQWRSLEIGAVFRVLDSVSIPSSKGSKLYAILETQHQEVIHVWITPIISKELLKYDLSRGNVFIKPLGKKLSNSSGKEYYNFDIVIDFM